MFPTSGRARLPLILALCLAPALPAAARTAEMLRLDGAVPAICELRIMDVARTVDIARGLENEPIATVGEKCNDQDGYRVVLMSSNGGVLAGSGRQVAYTVSYGPLRNALLKQPKAVVSRTAQTNWQTRTLAITVPPVGDEEASVFDSVIMSIEAP